MFDRSELWDWLKDHPVPSAVLLTAVAAAIVVCTLIFAIAFFQGREIRIWKYIIIAERPARARKPRIRSDGFADPVPTSDLIALFRDVNHFFLQVLIKRFQLTRQRNGGVLLEVNFDDNTPTIWSNQGKRAFMASMPKKKRDKAIEECQKDLDRFLIDGYGDSLTVEKPPLLFRYASGGTLPILNVNGDRYYCLIYREVHPIGWNIANGGCDTCDELLHPKEAMKRELSEELIIIDSKANTRLVFSETIDRPEFLLVRDLIEEHHPHLKIREREEKTVDPAWQTGPDELVVHIERQAPVKTSGCYVNINAIDLGIEIDRAMEIELDSLPQIIDGELSESVPGSPRLVNAPIGLFKIDELQGRLKEKRGKPSDFQPGIVYWGGTDHPGQETRHFVETLYIPTMERQLGKAQVDFFWATKHKYDLCPVTRNIIRRTAGC